MADLFNTAFRGRPAYRSACDALTGLGYERSNIRHNFEIPINQSEQRWSIDGVAFCEHSAQAKNASVTIFDLSTSGLRESEAVDRLRRTTAPFHLVFNELRGHFVLWATGFRSAKPLGEPLSPDSLARGLRDFAPDLKPEKVRRVKQGIEFFQHPLLAELNPLQLTFWAEEANGKLLTTHFGHALKALERAGFTDVREQGKLAAQLLAARILVDTGVMQDCGTVGEIPAAAEAKHFTDYFDGTLLQRYKKRAQESYDILKEISLATFQPEMLRDLYKNLFGKKETKIRGRFDTPLWLTHRIWQNIPVEFLKPENRVTLDMTCGWGSFLISAEDRLAGLPDMNGRRLSTYIFGNDNDSTTAELARVALLTSTGKDSWEISRKDARQLQLPRGKVPNIIVGNPPFAGDRKTQLTAETGGKRHELANEFLSHAVDLLAPGGFLAMVMPGSFVASEAGPQTRKKLLDACDVFEIWDLPTGIFDDAAVQPMVIFAKKVANKTTPSPFPVRIRNIQKQQAQILRFKESGDVTRSALVTSQQPWTAGYRASGKARTTHVLNYSTIFSDFEWRQILSKSVNLESIARAIPGCIKGSLGRCRTTDEKPKEMRWLTRASETIPSELVISYKDVGRVMYPNEVEEPRFEDRDLFSVPKVLLVSDPNPSWGKRLKVAIERRGYLASESFFVIGPRSDNSAITPEILAAVIRWKVCNAWVLERLRYPKINKWVLETMPFPKLLLSSPAELKKLSAAFVQIERAAQRGQIDNSAERETDEILRRAYGLEDERLWNRLVTVYQWDAVGNNGISFDEPVVSNQADWIVQGAVLDLHAEREEITIWLNSFNKPQTVPIVPAMPGWLLRPDVKFITKVPATEVRSGKLTGKFWGRFEPEHFTYLDRAESARMVNAMMKRNREARK